MLEGSKAESKKIFIYLYMYIYIYIYIYTHIHILIYILYILYIIYYIYYIYSLGLFFLSGPSSKRKLSFFPYMKMIFDEGIMHCKSRKLKTIFNSLFNLMISSHSLFFTQLKCLKYLSSLSSTSKLIVHCVAPNIQQRAIEHGQKLTPPPHFLIFSISCTEATIKRCKKCGD